MTKLEIGLERLFNKRRIKDIDEKDKPKLVFKSADNLVNYLQGKK